MTVFGWDASHYDAPPTQRDGIGAYTHKLTDGDHFYEDAEYRQSMEAMNGFGVPVLGPYHVLHGGQVSLSNQADWLIARADALTPWWRAFDYWTWQIDAEPFGYLVAPTVDQINSFGQMLADRSGLPGSRVLAYAAPWHYGSALSRLRFRLWSSNYGANPVGPYRQIYPGDLSSRWLVRDGASIVDVKPLLLQYGSRATIANQTTCDANAYRGTLDQLKAELAPKQGSNDSMAKIAYLEGDNPRRQWLTYEGTYGRRREFIPDGTLLAGLQKLHGASIQIPRPAAGYTEAQWLDAQLGIEVTPAPKCDCSGSAPADHQHGVSVTVSGTGTGLTGPAVVLDPTAPTG